MSYYCAQALNGDPLTCLNPEPVAYASILACPVLPQECDTAMDTTAADSDVFIHNLLYQRFILDYV
jgi:hypothetical protein